MAFANPKILWLLLIILPIVAHYILYTIRKGSATIRVSTVTPFESSPKTLRHYLRHLPIALRVTAIALIIVALARPQSTTELTKTTTEGVDIVMAIDVSSSMLAQDFKPDRITASKDVAADFILKRTDDRIGLVIFAAESYTQSPLTTDKSTLLSLLGKVRSGELQDGTAIGNGLATAINRLKESEAKSKVAIILTDGVNNMGQIAPTTSAQIAKDLGIKVYTIGVGSRGTAPYPVQNRWGEIVIQQMEVEIDEEILQEIASLTGGDYYRATNKDQLENIYNEINELERSEIEVENYTRHSEHYLIFVLIALGIVVFEFLLRAIWLKTIP